VIFSFMSNLLTTKFSPAQQALNLLNKLISQMSSTDNKSQEIPDNSQNDFFELLQVGLSRKNKFLPELMQTAKAIATRGKGILAADESTGTIEKRFQTIQVENSEENRRSYRELLFTSKDIGKYISGVIMYEETLFQLTKDGKKFVDILLQQGVIPGIKVDKGTKKFILFKR